MPMTLQHRTARHCVRIASKDAVATHFETKRRWWGAWSPGYRPKSFWKVGRFTTTTSDHTSHSRTEHPPKPLEQPTRSKTGVTSHERTFVQFPGIGHEPNVNGLPVNDDW